MAAAPPPPMDPLESGQQLRGAQAEDYLRSVDPETLQAAELASSRSDGLFGRPRLLVSGKTGTGHHALLIVDGDIGDDMDRQKLAEWQDRVLDCPQNLSLVLR